MEINNNVNRIQISLGDVLLEAPETSDYLNIAAQIIKMRETQLNTQLDSGIQTRQFESVVQPHTFTAQISTEELSLQKSDNSHSDELKIDPIPQANIPQTNQASMKPAIPKRGRWFITQFPLVTMDDGSKVILKSLEELRDILTDRGLQPHPRGDASMLLWQVRNRLGFHVEANASFE
jgi:hypothetical protein